MSNVVDFGVVIALFNSSVDATVLVLLVNTNGVVDTNAFIFMFVIE